MKNIVMIQKTKLGFEAVVDLDGETFTQDAVGIIRLCDMVKSKVTDKMLSALTAEEKEKFLAIIGDGR